jgi:hydrogenase 3 maturation protease
MTDQTEEKLARWLADAKKIAIAGIGNPIRHDDNAGLKIVQNLQSKGLDNVLLLEAETVPESYVSEIQEFQPSHVLLIDAAFLKLKPGQVQMVKSDELASFPAVSTHLLPLRIFCDLVTQTTGAKISLLLIEPGNVEFGEGLSTEVEEVTEKIAAILLKLLKNKKY